jgi:flagellar biosynthesis protein FlhB
LLLVSGLLALLLGSFSWVAQIDARLSPLAAVRRSIDESLRRLVPTAGIMGSAIAAILVFVLLAVILLAVVMNLAGIGVDLAGVAVEPGRAALSFSRWLMAGLLSLPVVYVGAVTVSAWKALSS